ncbi:shikimate kinase [Nocardioides marmoribigeumensis]|uniref:Shikimate kinase n=1 Tax=Nocardioides marmoribigeumensis TaxID=433649 RepID=A0ABU2BQT4_9ACTN|nr:shikimate kinase [Nocardioides marmoribigeumensis]MDR7361007.1 shikimate kinase [Nocardioides marmoribigeumensis]
MTEPHGPRVVLIGPMGAGKTTVADLLAQAWGCEVRDTDQDVEAQEGRSVQEIFIELGEPYFRDRERAAVRAAVREHTGVLALGGGAVMDPGTREVLVGQRVVFLNVGLADAAKRVGLGQGRPLLVGNIRSRIKTILTERLPIYAAVASHVVDTDGRPADEVADEVRAWVEAEEGA